jgi:hypothetical protein
MKEYRLKYSYLAVGDLKGLVDFATKMHTRDFAINYVARLRAEIESLSFLAGCYQKVNIGCQSYIIHKLKPWR